MKKSKRRLSIQERREKAKPKVGRQEKIITKVNKAVDDRVCGRKRTQRIRKAFVDRTKKFESGEGKILAREYRLILPKPRRKSGYMVDPIKKLLEVRPKARTVLQRDWLKKASSGAKFSVGIKVLYSGPSKTDSTEDRKTEQTYWSKTRSIQNMISFMR